MDAQTLKARIAANEFTIGSWITLPCPEIAEILSRTGFDWLVVDMEHSAIGIAEAQGIIRAIELGGAVPLVRVSANDPTEIKRAMDAGSRGVIVPMVNSADDARSAVAAVKYPPVGTRGVGLARAQAYGFGFESYRDRVNDESVVVVQVEHIDAVSSLEAILATAGVDAFIVGPYDLSASLGVPGDFADPRVADALATVIETAKRLGKSAGFHVVEPSAEQLNSKIAEGYRFLALGTDALYLGTLAAEQFGRIDRP